MSGMRLSVCVPGATAVELLEVGRSADHWGLAALWIGDPRGEAPNSDDSYVTAAAAAVAAVTDDLRLGLFLRLAREKVVVRIAEDVAVLDQASGGRVEVGFAGAPEPAVSRLLGAWSGWELPGGETVPVLPGPAQPVVPSLVVDGDRAAGSGGRTLLLVEPEIGEGGIVDWLAAGPHERVNRLRGDAEASGAREILLLLGGRPLTEQDFAALGTVLVPGLRAAVRDVRDIVADAWVWLTEKQELQAPPAAGERVDHGR